MDEKSQEAIYHSLETLRQADEYYRWIAERVSPYIRGKALEIGAGIGNFARWGRQYANEYHVSEIDPRLVQKLQSDFDHAFLWDVYLPFPTADLYDTIVILNVVEHLENDLKAVQCIRDRLAPGGRLILMVPAMQFLFGTMDQSFGHYRRYTKQSMGHVMEKAGFKILRKEYINVIGMLGWFLYGRVLKRPELPDRLCSRFNLVLPLLKLERPIARFIGLSLIVIGQK